MFCLRDHNSAGHKIALRHKTSNIIAVLCEEMYRNTFMHEKVGCTTTNCDTPKTENVTDVLYWERLFTDLCISNVKSVTLTKKNGIGLDIDRLHKDHTQQKSKYEQPRQ